MKASEAYGWLLDQPVGAYVVVRNELADGIMLTQGGMLFRNDTWHAIKGEALSPGTTALCLIPTPYRERMGVGPFVSLSGKVPIGELYTAEADDEPEPYTEPAEPAGDFAV